MPPAAPDDNPTVNVHEQSPTSSSAPDAQLQLFIESTTDYAILTLDRYGHVSSWNRGAERLKGYVEADILGQHFSAFYTAEDQEAQRPADILRQAATQGRYGEQGWRIRKDGSRFWADVSITAIRDPLGELVGFGKVTKDLTEQRERQAVVDRLQADQESILAGLAEGVLLYAYNKRQDTLQLQHANASAAAMLHLDYPTLNDIPAKRRSWPTVIDQSGRRLSRSDMPHALAAHTGQSVSNFIWGMPAANGQTNWFSSNARPLFDATEDVVQVVLSLSDVTEREAAAQQLSAAHDRFAALIANSSDVICIVDAASIVQYTSPSHREIFGEPAAARIGKPLSELIDAEDRTRFLQLLDDLVNGGSGAASVDLRVRRQDATMRYLEVTAADHTRARGIEGVVLNGRDVTDRVETASRLAHEAMHDPLTDLPNRALLLDRLSHALARAQRPREKTALLFVDLDHFKNINDSLGHAVGDAVLVTVAARLQRVLRPGDTVARLGGDEFVVLAENVPNRAAARLIAQRTQQAISESIEIDDHSVVVGCSIGIALAEGGSAEALLQQADTALYRAKAHGRGRWELYDRAMRLGARRRLDVELMLRDALREDRVLVHYQPIIRLADLTQVGCEALVRLVQPDGTLTAPDNFIPVAEDSGLIVPLGRRVLEQACLQHRRRPVEMFVEYKTSVNLSARQLREPMLLRDIDQALHNAHMRPDQLCLELTESTLMAADNSTRRSVDAIAEQGVLIALDDFGTGMSSLAHIRNFPIKILKIDRTFVAGLGTRPADTAVVKAIIGLGQSLNLVTVAEGVETQSQADTLASLGCDQAQGYLYGRAAPAEAHTY